MAHRFLIKDIALQAGTSTATVDRVLNRRGNVRRQTVDRVQRAIVELERQHKQLAMTGRKLLVDVIVEAPQTFLDALQGALEEELPLMQPVVFRLRTTMRERFPVAEMEHALRRVERLGSDGVILMGPDRAPIRQAIDRLEDAGIPVVTLASDMAGTRRSAYVGLDNRRAGATAAWFLQKFLSHKEAPRLLVTIRNDRFRGEEERLAGFRAALAERDTDAGLTVLVEGKDRPGFLESIDALCKGPALDAIYSIGGGNRAILNRMARTGRTAGVFIAHDLDPDNQALLRGGRIDLLIYHDLQEDMRNACRVLMARHLSRAILRPPQNAALRLLVPPIFAEPPGRAV